MLFTICLFLLGEQDDDENDEEDIDWVQCDGKSCQKWYHQFCVEEK